jgi:hypothetical protein
LQDEDENQDIWLQNKYENSRKSLQDMCENQDDIGLQYEYENQDIGYGCEISMKIQEKVCKMCENQDYMFTNYV